MNSFGDCGIIGQGLEILIQAGDEIGGNGFSCFESLIDFLIGVFGRGYGRNACRHWLISIVIVILVRRLGLHYNLLRVDVLGVLRASLARKIFP